MSIEYLVRDNFGFFRVHIRCCFYDKQTKSIQPWSFLRSVNFPIFHHYQYTGYLSTAAFIFERCCRSSDALTPVQYKSDSKNITPIKVYIFKLIKILHTLHDRFQNKFEPYNVYILLVLNFAFIEYVLCQI